MKPRLERRSRSGEVIHQVVKYNDGIDNIVNDAIKNGKKAIEIKEKGTHDEQGVMVDLEALTNRKLFLAAKTFSNGVPDEAKEHNVGLIKMPDEYDSEWLTLDVANDLEKKYHINGN